MPKGHLQAAFRPVVSHAKFVTDAPLHNNLQPVLRSAQRQPSHMQHAMILAKPADAPLIVTRHNTRETWPGLEAHISLELRLSPRNCPFCRAIEQSSLLMQYARFVI